VVVKSLLRLMKTAAPQTWVAAFLIPFEEVGAGNRWPSSSVTRPLCPFFFLFFAWLERFVPAFAALAAFGGVFALPAIARFPVKLLALFCWAERLSGAWGCLAVIVNRPR